jgi:CRISPR-associated protein Csx14
MALISTLGGKPQVSTFALDALQEKGIFISRVYAVHLSISDKRIEQSVKRLSEESRKRTPSLRFEGVPVRRMMVQGQGRPIETIDDPAAPTAIWQTLHRLISALKEEEFSIHLCMTGGPRLLGAMAMSAASLLFASDDKLWHLYTPEETRERAGEGKFMHATPADGVRLIEVPVLSMGDFLPGLRTAAYRQPEAFFDAGQRQLNKQDEAACRAVASRLSVRQLEVLRALASGQPHKEIAVLLHVAPSTLRTHMKTIYAECRNAWSMPAGAKMQQTFVVNKFGRLGDPFWEEYA